MPYQWLPHIVLLVSLVGAILLLSRRLPDAARKLQERDADKEPHQEVIDRAPRKLFGRLWSAVGFYIKRAGNFILEAKDLKKPASVGYRIRKLFPRPRQVVRPSLSKLEGLVKDEQYFLKLIQEQPKNLQNYNLLGKYYLDLKRFAEAKDIFTFLVKRDPGNATFYARLAFSNFKLGSLSDAAVLYEKSLALDGSQPNRYYNLGLTLEELKRKDEAEMAFKKALEIEPENEKYQKALSDLSKK